MKRIFSFSLLLLLAVFTSVQAATTKVYADFSNPTLASQAQWDAATNTMSWTMQYANQVRGLNLPSGDLSQYEKLVVECADLKAQSFRILIYKGEQNHTLVVNKEGVTEFNLSESVPEDYLKNATEVVLSGGNQDATGSVRIISLYMETFDDTTAPELSFTPERVILAPGEPLTVPTLNNPHSLPVTYSATSRPDGFITVNPTTGSVTLGSGEGSGKVTATFAGNEEYKAGSATYSIIVKEPIDLGDGHWVGTWATAPMESGSNNNPPSPGLANNTLRQIVQVSLGGEVVRLKLSNHFGNQPVEIKGVELALAKTAGSSPDVDEATTTVLTFDGDVQTTIAAGKKVVSDPVRFPIGVRGNVAITIHYGQASSSVVSGHPGSRTTSYLVKGNTSNFASASKTDHWYHILAMEVFAPEEAGCVAVLGNSITDGRGSTTNQQDRWTDQLSRRLLANEPTSHIGMLNLGIGGNCVVAGGLGPAASNRYQRDLFEQEGVKWIVLFEGVNDLGGSSNGEMTARRIIEVWKQIIRQAHQKGIRVFGATITPFKNNSYYSKDHEAGRQRVNKWILSTKMLDGVIDLAAAACDANDSEQLNPKFLFENDWLHLNAEGYVVLGGAADLSLFTQDGPLAADDEEDEEEVKGIWIEAENLRNDVYGKNFRLVEDATASGGKYLETVKNQTTVSNDKADQLLAAFSVEEASTYYIYARVLCPSYDDDSYFVRMDNAEWTMVNGLATNSWEWKQLWGGALKKGTNYQFGIAGREDGARIDKLCITTSATAPLTMGGSESAGIESQKVVPAGTLQVFDLQGRRLSRLQPGLNIVRNSSEVKKVLARR
jgi:lysophospholipase L1-like esterase